MIYIRSKEMIRRQQKARKLTLNKRTLAVLSGEELRGAVGGMPPNDEPCDTTVCQTDPACDQVCKSALNHTIC
jgi:hypothetical protein